MSSARGQYRRASLEDDDLIDPDDGRDHFLVLLFRARS